MPEPVRVRDNKTGHEYSTYAVDEHGRVDEGLQVLKGEPAADERGDLIPPKYPTSTPRTAASTGSAATPKES